MSAWWQRVTAGAALAPGSPALVLLDASGGSFTLGLPLAISGGRFFLFRIDASANLVTVAGAGNDWFAPADWNAPVFTLGAGQMVCVQAAEGANVWARLESAMPILLREAAAAAVVAYGTIAGDAVESERVDGVAPGDMPRVILLVDASLMNQEKIGSTPTFQGTAQIVAQCLVERARASDAVSDLDLLISQVQDALFGDPVWPTLSGAITEARVQRKMEAARDRVVGDGRLVISCEWIESYMPRVVTPLATVTATIVEPAQTPEVFIEIGLAP